MPKKKDALSSGCRINLCSFRYVSNAHKVETDNEVQFIGLDTTTQGAWKSGYGKDGYSVICSKSILPFHCNFYFVNESEYIWDYTSKDIRVLEDPEGNDVRIAGCILRATGFNVEIFINSNQLKNVSFYLLDFEPYNRKVRVEVVDSEKNIIMHSCDIDNFCDGVYIKYKMKGRVSIRFNLIAGANAALSGIFFD